MNRGLPKRYWVLSLESTNHRYTESVCILPSMSEKRNSEESESARLESLYRKASDPVLRTHLLMVWRMSLGESIREVARMVGYSEKWTGEIARRYESEGVEGLGEIVGTAILEPRRGRCSRRT